MYIMFFLSMNYWIIDRIYWGFFEDSSGFCDMSSWFLRVLWGFLRIFPSWEFCDDSLGFHLVILTWLKHLYFRWMWLTSKWTPTKPTTTSCRTKINVPNTFVYVLYKLLTLKRFVILTFAHLYDWMFFHLGCLRCKWFIFMDLLKSYITRGKLGETNLISSLAGATDCDLSNIQIIIIFSPKFIIPYFFPKPIFLFLCSLYKKYTNMGDDIKDVNSAVHHPNRKCLNG